jgi:hypothetical protein
MSKLWFNANSEKQIIDFDNESEERGQSAPHRPGVPIQPRPGKIRTVDVEPTPSIRNYERTRSQYGNPPNFMSMINEARQQGKYIGSDKDALTQIHSAWARLQNPPQGDPGKKWVCKGCGGGKGACVLGGCFSGDKITWDL